MSPPVSDRLHGRAEHSVYGNAPGPLFAGAGQAVHRRSGSRTGTSAALPLFLS
jgi:hypothetical protein